MTLEMTGADRKALESAPAHARGKQEPVGSDRAMYVCECCKDAGEEHCLHPREDMRIFEGEWWCEECAQQGCPDADTLPLAPELFAAPPAESEEVARLREEHRLMCQFIVNGVDNGYIRHPDTFTGHDPAIDTIAFARAAALDKATQEGK